MTDVFDIVQWCKFFTHAVCGKLIQWLRAVVVKGLNSNWVGTLHLVVADPVSEICFEEPKTLPIASDSTLHVLNTHNFTCLCRSTSCLIYHSENRQLKHHLIAIILGCKICVQNIADEWQVNLLCFWRSHFDIYTDIFCSLPHFSPHMSGLYLKIGHNHFLLYPLQFSFLN